MAKSVFILSWLLACFLLVIVDSVFYRKRKKKVQFISLQVFYGDLECCTVGMLSIAHYLQLPLTSKKLQGNFSNFSRKQVYVRSVTTDEILILK